MTLVECEYCKRLFRPMGLNGHKYSCLMNPNKVERISPFKGKTHSDESKLKNKIATIRQHVVGRGASPPNWTGKTHTEETKQKISTALKGNQNSQHRGDRQSYYNNIRMDSSWEVKTAKYFDDNKIQWKYNVKGYVLSDGRHYYPDFFYIRK